ncbi:MAG: redoxin domain-containing protein [Acidobacteria bacterium]|nr:redoxin domain-containing protein [Acidobacteriota bacterium]
MPQASHLLHAPDFTLRNQKGDETSLADLRQRGPVLLAFHRGTW